MVEKNTEELWNDEEYIEPGPQTKLTNIVYNHATKIKDSDSRLTQGIKFSEPFLTIQKTSEYVFSFPLIKGFTNNPKTEEEKRTNYDLKRNNFRKRDLNQILEEGAIPTCSDFGILFRGLMIAQGIPTSYYETFHEDFIKRYKSDPNNNFHGHVFARVFFEGKPILIAPSRDPLILTDEIHIFPYIPFKEGKDSWDIGVFDWEGLINEGLQDLEILEKRYESNIKLFNERKILPYAHKRR